MAGPGTTPQTSRFATFPALAVDTNRPMTSTAYKHFIAASAHLHRLVRAQLVGDDGLAHAPTQILGAARLAGLLMFRGFRVDSSALAPGMRMLSDEARHGGLRLRDALFATLRQLGHPLGPDDLDPHCMTPALSRLAFVEVHERLTPSTLAYLEQSPMGVRNAALATAAACAGLVHDHAAALPAHQAAALACCGFEEGLTTVPWPLRPAQLVATRGWAATAHIRTMS